jgi:hypothetical protein
MGAFNMATMTYDSTDDTIGVAFDQFTDGASCGVSASVTTVFGVYPVCSSIGITFNKATGIITFASTPILQSGSVFPTQPPIGITATGSLSFTPF